VIICMPSPTWYYTIVVTRGETDNSKFHRMADRMDGSE
jgi:hypothetical protein